MLLFRISMNRASALSRLTKLTANPSLRLSVQKCRANTTLSAAQNTKKTLYPERLLIYHSGTGRTVFLGCLKLTTIFICTFFCLIAAPNHFYSEAEPPWVAGAVLLSGVVPMVFVAYSSGPFVNYVHLRLPTFARNSRELLHRYSQNLPKHAEVDITMMNFIGKPRVSRMKVSELYPTRKRFGLANYARDATEVNAKRPWWMGKVPSQFGIHGTGSKIMGGFVWENVARGIARNKRS